MSRLSVVESIFITIVIISFLTGAVLLITAGFLNQEKDKEKIKTFKLFWWISFGIFVLTILYYLITIYLRHRNRYVSPYFRI